MTWCEHFSLPAHLMIYRPKYEDNDVKSFLVLGELCENSLALIRIDDRKRKSNHLEEILETETRQKLRSKLELIQAKCIKKAKLSLEMYLQFKLPTVVATDVADFVFGSLFKVGEDWNKAEEILRVEEVDNEDLGRLRETYAQLASIYNDLQYCLNREVIFPNISSHQLIIDRKELNHSLKYFIEEID